MIHIQTLQRNWAILRCSVDIHCAGNDCGVGSGHSGTPDGDVFRYSDGIEHASGKGDHIAVLGCIVGFRQGFGRIEGGDLAVMTQCGRREVWALVATAMNATQMKRNSLFMTKGFSFALRHSQAWLLIKKKSVMPLPVVRPTLWGLRIAHLSWTDNMQKPHAEYGHITPDAHTPASAWNISTPRHLLLSHSWLRLKVAKFQSVKKERQVHAIHYVSLPSRTAPTGLLQTVRIRKYITFPANHKILLGNALPLTHFNTVYMWTFYPFIVYAQSVCAFYYDSQPHVSMQLRRYMWIQCQTGIESKPERLFVRQAY